MPPGIEIATLGRWNGDKRHKDGLKLRQPKRQEQIQGKNTDRDITFSFIRVKRRVLKFRPWGTYLPHRLRRPYFQLKLFSGVAHLRICLRWWKLQKKPWKWSSNGCITMFLSEWWETPVFEVTAAYYLTNSVLSWWNLNIMVYYKVLKWKLQSCTFPSRYILFYTILS